MPHVSVHPNWSNNQGISWRCIINTCSSPEAICVHHSVYVIETASAAELQPCKFVHYHRPPLRDSKSNGSKASTRSLLFTQYVCTPDESKSHYVQAQQSEGTRVPPADFLICNADQQISALLHLSDRLTITPRYSSKCVQHGDLPFRIGHGYITVVY